MARSAEAAADASGSDSGWRDVAGALPTLITPAAESLARASACASSDPRAALAHLRLARASISAALNAADLLTPH